MIISNKIKCKFCGDIIESKNRHDFKFCSCGKCAVDGGHDYLKRSFSGDNPEECFEDLSVVIEENLEEEYLEKLKKIPLTHCRVSGTLSAAIYSPYTYSQHIDAPYDILIC